MARVERHHGEEREVQDRERQAQPRDERRGRLQTEVAERQERERERHERDLVDPAAVPDRLHAAAIEPRQEKQVPTRDGRWFKIRIMPYRTSEDKIDGLVITFIEITQSKQLEADLKHSQKMLQSFIQAVPSVIVGLSFDGRIIELNAEAEKLFGCKREEVLGEKYVDLFIPPIRRKKVEAEMKELLAGSLPSRIVNIIKTPNGQEFTVEWSAHQLVGDQEKLTAMIAIGINISKS
jgi:PAS domain S-box-containing protein